ncbi:MAG: hypothetical protein AB7L09_00290 [Nitrospira sp.]
MQSNTTIAETLRNARGEVDLITKLKEGSLEARRARLVQALESAEWAGPGAELIATYPHHVITRKSGVLMRVPVEEADGQFTFGKPDIYSVPTPALDIGTEVMETAKSAVDLILSEDYDRAAPMVQGIAGAMDVKGDLHRQVSMAVQLKSLGRKTWWEETVAEQFAHDAPVPEWIDDGQTSVTEALSGLNKILKEGAAHAASALRILHTAGKANTGAIECVGDIAEDLKSALTILNSVNRDDQAEMLQVHEEVRQVVPRLLAGINFLSHLTREAAGPGQE